jgi:hypothetical protein
MKGSREGEEGVSRGSRGDGKEIRKKSGGGHECFRKW